MRGKDAVRTSLLLPFENPRRIDLCLCIDYQSLAYHSSSQIIRVFQFLEDHFGFEVMEEVRIYASMVYLAALKQLKRGVITKQQMTSVVFGGLFTYLAEAFPLLEEEKLRKALLDFRKANFKIPSVIQKYL